MEEQDRLPFPYEYEELKPYERSEVTRLFKSTSYDPIGVGPVGYKVLKRYMTEAENIYNLQVRQTDIFVITYQRSGTTWIQELVWLLANNFDYTEALSKPLTRRYYFPEVFMFLDKEWITVFNEDIKDPEIKAKSTNILEKFITPVTSELSRAPSPRFIKSHLPLCLLPPTLLDTAKMVYVARDPRDVAVSSYHHSRLFKFINFVGTFKEFWNLFMNNQMTLTPYFGT